MMMDKEYLSTEQHCSNISCHIAIGAGHPGVQRFLTLHKHLFHNQIAMKKGYC